MGMRKLFREPYRGGQICGEQLEYGVMPGRVVFCGEPKQPGEFFCPAHYEDIVQSGAYGPIRTAEGNARGLHVWRVSGVWKAYDSDMNLLGEFADAEALKQTGIGVLQWEGEDSEPVDATPEETAEWLASGRGCAAVRRQKEEN